MSKLEKFFTKGMKILTMALLFMIVIGNVAGSFYVGAGDVEDVGYTDTAETYNDHLGVGGQSSLHFWDVNFNTALQVLMGLLAGLGVFSLQDQAALLQESESAQRIGYGVLDKSTALVTYAYATFPTDVNPQVYMAEEWSPSRINQAEAASSGQQMLTPIKELWNYTKNIAYVGFVVIVIIIGFMIMFRQKINGQVAVSITNSIPRVIIGMILVHASFFLAGLILSISTFIMALIGNMITEFYKQNGISMELIELGGPWYFLTHTTWFLTGAVDISAGFWNTGVGTQAKQTLQGAITSWGGTLISTFKNLGTGAGNLLATTASISMSAFNALVGNLGGSGISWKDILVKFIILAGLLYAGFKIFFNLLLAYAQIFIKVVILPLVTLIGTLPGQEKIIIDSYKGIFADALVFPVTFAMINIGAVIALNSMKNAITFPGDIQTTLVDPGGGNIGGLVAYAIVLAAASADKFVKEFLKIQGSQAAAIATKGVIGMSSKAPLVGGLLKGFGE